jgi:NAD(P)-dependent dehydrogenase (short-subunit alcohol dehydrogenase family)
MDLHTFAGKVALVTGSTTGIGLATARRFSELGARVILHGQNETCVKHALEHFPAAASGYAADLRSAEDIGRLIAQVERDFHRLDVLVNNAGVAWASPFEDAPLAKLDEMLRVNVLAVYLCTRAALPLLRAGRHPVVVNVASNLAAKPLPHFAHYAATKAAVNALTLALRAELAPDGVTVCAIMPGAVQTAHSTIGSASLRASIDADVIRMDPATVADAIAQLVALAPVASPGLLLLEHKTRTG